MSIISAITRAPTTAAAGIAGVVAVTLSAQHVILKVVREDEETEFAEDGDTEFTEDGETIDIDE